MFIHRLIDEKKYDIVDTILRSINVPLVKSMILTEYLDACEPARKFLIEYDNFESKVISILKERNEYDCITV